MVPKEVIVNCSFCNLKIPCPENMTAGKHACFECFNKLKENIDEKEIHKIHVAIPKEQIEKAMPDLIVQYAMQSIFPEFWNNHKLKLQEMSKRELAEEAFLAGVQIAIGLKEGYKKEKLNMNKKS